MMHAPFNDESCLRGLNARAEQLATTPEARAVANRMGDMGTVVEVLRARPQRNDDGRGKVGPLVACDVPQRARFWSPDPDCFERALDYAVMMLVLRPDVAVRFARVETARGPHVVPMAADGSGRYVPVDLYRQAPKARNADMSGDDNTGIRSPEARTVVTVVDGIGGAALRAFGLGAGADYIHGLWVQEGVLGDRSRTSSPEYPSPPAPRATQPRERGSDGKGQEGRQEAQPRRDAEDQGRGLGARWRRSRNRGAGRSRRAG